MRNTLYVSSDASFNGRVDISGAAFLKNILDVSSAVTMRNTLYVSSDASFNGRVDISGAAFLKNILDVSSAVTMRNTLYVSSDASFNGRVDISGAAFLKNILDVSSAVTMRNTLYVSSDASFNGRVDISGAAFLKNRLDVSSAVTMRNTLYVSSDSSFNGRVDISGAAFLKNTLTISQSLINGGLVYNKVAWTNQDWKSTVDYHTGSAGTNSQITSNFSVTKFFDEASGAFSYMIIGYFRPLTSDTYTIRMNADDQAIFWIGNNARNERFKYNNADMFSFNSNVNTTHRLIAGLNYPIRILFANTSGFGGLVLQYKTSINPTYTSFDFSQFSYTPFPGSTALVTKGGANVDDALVDTLSVSRDASVLGATTLRDNVSIYGLIQGGLCYNTMTYTGQDWATNFNYHTSSTGENLILKGTDAFGNFISTSDISSFMFYGYFRPLVSDTYIIYMSADDKGIFWLGNDARPDRFNYNNSLINILSNSSGITTQFLYAGINYPIRILYANIGAVGYFDLKYKNTNNTEYTQFTFSQFYYSPFPGYTASQYATIMKVDGGASIDDIFANTLNVYNSSSLNGRVDISGAAFLKNILDVSSAVTMRNTLYVSSDSSFNGRVDISGAAFLKNILDVSSAVTMRNTLYVSSDASFNRRVDISGAATMRNTLYVSSDTSFNGRVDISGAAFLKNILDVSSAVTMRNTLYVSSDASFNGRMDISGALYLKNNLGVIGNSTFTGVLMGSTQLTVSCELVVKGIVTTGISGVLMMDVCSNSLFSNRTTMVGRSNTAFGNSALNAFGMSVGLPVGNEGFNTALSTGTLSSLTNGYANTATGYNSMKSATTAYNCTALGYNAGFTNVTGNGNTFLGWNSDCTGTGYSQSTAIGYSSKIFSSNQIVIGTSNETVFIPGRLSISGNIIQTGAFQCLSGVTINGVLLCSSSTTLLGSVTCNNSLLVQGNLTVNGITNLGTVNGTIFNSTSDYRMKSNIENISENYNVDKLRPVTYTFTKNLEQHIGFIAHELQEFFPTAVNGQKDGKNMQSINYSELIPVLVKEIQNLKKEVSKMKLEISNLM
jgi:predicted acyltransferase (DUF342 family)